MLGQKNVELDYIVCDPGSTDGSREIIDSYKDRLAHIVYEKDEGPADGLNKGFALATGEIYGYLNSDDTLEPDALAKVAAYFETHPACDVVCAHAWITDKDDKKIRRVWSESYNRLFVAYGASTQIQPSTFIRREAFLKAEGFDKTNRRNWDGELLAKLYATGARIEILNAFLSTYRLHATSITNSGQEEDPQTKEANAKAFELLMGRRPRKTDHLLHFVFRTARHLLHPFAMVERLRKGPVFKRGAE